MLVWHYRAATCSGATRDLRNASSFCFSVNDRALNFLVDSSAWPPWKATACSSVVARPSCRYGPASRTPHSGGVRHSWAVATTAGCVFAGDFTTSCGLTGSVELGGGLGWKMPYDEPASVKP